MLFARSLHIGCMIRQWKKACAIDSSISLHWMYSCEIARCAEDNLLPIQRALQITSQVSKVLMLLRHLILEAHSHNKQPSSFVKLSSSNKSPQTALLTNIQYNALLNNRQLSERLVCNQEKTFRVCWHLC